MSAACRGGRLSVLAVLVMAALLLLLAGGPAPARAHEMSIAEMDLREIAPGDFAWQWLAGDKRPVSEDLSPRWPPHCQADGQLLHCGAQGLRGEVAIDGVGQRYSAAMLKTTWADGQYRVYTVTGAQPVLRLQGSADDTRGMGEVLQAYGVLGIEHILSGFDHLLFVIGLLFLVGFRRRLVWTISAFTLAHSLTLASAALGWLTLRPPPVEACIALSIVLVAAEALHRRQTLARRWPALVAFGFGLVHGLGFAGALAEIGLPQRHLVSALLAFNLGVEAGQLAVLAVCWAAVLALGWAATRLAARWPAAPAWPARLRTPLLYAIGTLAAYWSWSRIAAIGG